MGETDYVPRDAHAEFEALVRTSGFPKHVARRKVAQAIFDGTWAPILIFPEDLVRVARIELGQQ